MHVSPASLVILNLRLKTPYDMLHRASKHSTKLDGLRYWQKSLDALYLPWLCPSLYASRRSGSRQTSTAATPRLSTHPAPNLSLSTKKNAHGSKRIRRGLASAVTASYDTSQDHYIPFEALDISSRTQADFDRRWLPPVTPAFDPDSALIINDSVTTKPPRFRAVNAISGEVEEIRQTIRACIQVDRLGRAATLMRRLNEIYKPDAPELVAAHNDFLRELVHKIRHSKDPQVLRLIHKWFEVDLRKIRVVPDAVTYALMIQAGLQESSPKRVDRTVKRYMFLADQAGIRDNVMQVILLMSGEQNTGRITEVCLNYSDWFSILMGYRLLLFSPSLPLSQHINLKTLQNMAMEWCRSRRRSSQLFLKSKQLQQKA